MARATASYADAPLRDDRLGELSLATLAPSFEDGSISADGADVTLVSSWIDPRTARKTTQVTAHHSGDGNGRAFRSVGTPAVGSSFSTPRECAISNGRLIRLRIASWDPEGGAPGGSASGKCHALEWCVVEAAGSGIDDDDVSTTETASGWSSVPLPPGSKWHHTSGEFATLEASPNGEMVLLCGEGVKKADAPANGSNSGKSPSAAAAMWSGEKPAAKPAGRVHRGDWGELLYEATDPRLFVVDLAKRAIAPLDTDGAYGPNHACGQGVWIDDTSIAFTAYERDSRNRPGLRYCVNRRSSVARVCLESGLFSTLSDLSEGDARCPVVLNSAREVAFLETRARGDWDAHGSCSMVRVRDVECKSDIRDVVGVVSRADGGDGDDDGNGGAHPGWAPGFPGVFTGGFVRNAALFAPGKLVLSSIWRTSVKVLVIDVETGAVEALGDENVEGLHRATHVIDIAPGAILCSTSGPTDPPKAVVISRVDGSGGEDDGNANEWRAVTVVGPPAALTSAVSDLKCTVLSDTGFEALLVEPPTSTRPKNGFPLVAFPHGGPHSAFSGDYISSVAYLAMCGYAVLEINYRGSTGFGMDFLLELKGNAGVMDVRDCCAAVAAALAHGDGQGFDRKRVGVIGGSHGGFLGAHLVGVTPESHPDCLFKGPFRCAVLRNPVIDIATMSGTTDIPDWCESVTGASGSLDLMRDRSPIAGARRVTGAVLLMIGLKDLRVPPAQGFQFWRALDDIGKCKAREVVTYESDSHPLSSPATQVDVNVRTAAWLDTYLA